MKIGETWKYKLEFQKVIKHVNANINKKIQDSINETARITRVKIINIKNGMVHYVNILDKDSDMAATLAALVSVHSIETFTSMYEKDWEYES